MRGPVSKRIAQLSGVGLVVGCLAFLIISPSEPRHGFAWEAPQHHAHAAPAAHQQPPPADNGPCLVCHANFEDESLAHRHAKAGVGCVKCHGESEAHRSDEGNTTPPDRMYPRSEIDRGCRHCHTTHNAPAKLVIATYLKRCQHISDPEKITCTDCHGDHRMAQRTVLWDKRTGRLLGPNEKPAE